jgi:transposase InsO family protein
MSGCRAEQKARSPPAIAEQPALSLALAARAAWTLQLREAIGFEERYQYLLHDRDSIFAKHLDESVNRLGIEVLKSPPRCPKANAICERVIGTIRRECLGLADPHFRIAFAVHSEILVERCDGVGGQLGSRADRTQERLIASSVSIRG